MPESITYVVKQTRQVTVTANNAHDAAKIAEAAFGQATSSDIKVEPNLNRSYEVRVEGVYGYTTGYVVELDLHIIRN